MKIVRFSQKGLVGYWRFDEETGSTAKDSSPYGNDGTIYGATRVRGIIGKALSFDGVDDYVDCGNDKSLDVTTEATLIAWVKLKPSGDWQAIFSKGPDIYENYELLVYSDLSYLHTAWNFDVGRKNHYWLYSIPENEWTFIVLTWKAPLMKLYINGEFKETWDTGANYAITRTEPLLIGHEYGTSRYVNGTIDEVRIYNRALSPGEIKIIYAFTKYIKPHPIIMRRKL